MRAKLWAATLAILGLNLGNALGLYFGKFGLEAGQGFGPPGLRFGHLGPESGQGSGLYFGNFGPLLWQFWACIWARLQAPGLGLPPMLTRR